MPLVKYFLVTNAACGSIPGNFTLYDHTEGAGTEHASLYRGVIEGIHKGVPVEHLVNVTTLDQFAGDHDIELIHLLKIDTEGNELEVLKGAAGLLRKKIGSRQSSSSSTNEHCELGVLQGLLRCDSELQVLSNAPKRFGCTGPLFIAVMRGLCIPKYCGAP